MIKDLIKSEFVSAVNKAIENKELGELPFGEAEKLLIEIPKNQEFGDFAVNVSSFARHARLAPPKIAEIVKNNFQSENFKLTVIAGFINFKISNQLLNSTIKRILDEKQDFGKNNYGNGEKVNLEYVSANPTGPFHIGHGRWAAMGSALANILKFTGYDVYQEFYINDAGNQINNLGRSLYVRVLQNLGIDAKFPETEEEGSKNFYAGEYLIEVAESFVNENPDKIDFAKQYANDYLNLPTEAVKVFSDFAKAKMLGLQKALLEEFRVNFDCFYSETSLHQSGDVEKTLQTLKDRDKLYEKEGALWFKSSEYGDDQDRVVKKTDGSNTYLTADIAYHHDKMKRGFDTLINIWGADHHGYVPRMKASLEALGYDSNKLEVLLGQLVNLIIDGEQVRMGKRKKMLTLGDLIDEVGVDATRFWMIMRSIDTTLDFDVNLAKSCSDENPVFYVQYAHARACSIIRTATNERLDSETKQTLPAYIEKAELEKIFNSKDFNANSLTTLWENSDEKALSATKSLVLKLESFEDVVMSATITRSPYMIARYVLELASDFHHFYTFTRVLNVENDLMKARLAIVESTKQILSNALSLLGVKAPESM